MDGKANLKILAILSITHVCVDLPTSALPAIAPLIKDALCLNYAQIGTMILVFNLTASVIQPCFGYVSDKVEMKRFLPISVIFTFGGFALVGLAATYGLLLVFLVISGAGAAFYHPESFKITHYLSGRRQATGTSLFQVGGNLGLAFGPLVATSGAYLADLRGATLLFVVPGLIALSLLIFVRARLRLPDKSQPATTEKDGLQAARGTKRSARLPLSLLVISVSLRSFAHIGLMVFAPFYYIMILHGNTAGAGRLVFAFLSGGALGTLAGGVLGDKMGHKAFLCLSLITSVPLLILFLNVSGIAIFFLLFCIGFVLVSSFSVTVVMGQTLLPHRLGMASGLMLGFVIGMGGVGAAVLGRIADAWGILNVMKLVAIMPAIALIPLLALSYPEHARERAKHAAPVLPKAE
jgi:FSR family fosmidomycin resistance protein-like MFS transporter